MTHSRKARIAALLICVVFCCAIAFSAFFIIAEADHDCAGEHCPICAEIAACVVLLETAAVAVIFSASRQFHHMVAACICGIRFADSTSTTLVSLKILLLN